VCSSGGSSSSSRALAETATSTAEQGQQCRSPDCWASASAQVGSVNHSNSNARTSCVVMHQPETPVLLCSSCNLYNQPKQKGRHHLQWRPMLHLLAACTRCLLYVFEGDSTKSNCTQQRVNTVRQSHHSPVAGILRCCAQSGIGCLLCNLSPVATPRCLLASTPAKMRYRKCVFHDTFLTYVAILLLLLQAPLCLWAWTPASA
jgi:hypothetical protein